MSQDSEDDDIVCLSSGHLGRRQPKRIKREDGTPESSFSQPDRFHQAPENARSSCSPTPSTSSVRRSTPVSDVEVFDMTLSSISTIEEDATLIEPDVTSLQKANHDASGKHLSGSPENTTSKPQIAFAKAGIIPLEDDSLVATDEVLGPCYKLVGGLRCFRSDKDVCSILSRLEDGATLAVYASASAPQCFQGSATFVVRCRNLEQRASIFSLLSQDGNGHWHEGPTNVGPYSSSSGEGLWYTCKNHYSRPDKKANRFKRKVFSIVKECRSTVTAVDYAVVQYSWSTAVPKTFTPGRQCSSRAVTEAMREMASPMARGKTSSPRELYLKQNADTSRDDLAINPYCGPKGVRQATNAKSSALRKVFAQDPEESLRLMPGVLVRQFKDEGGRKHTNYILSNPYQIGLIAESCKTKHKDGCDFRADQFPRSDYLYSASFRREPRTRNPSLVLGPVMFTQSQCLASYAVLADYIYGALRDKSVDMEAGDFSFDFVTDGETALYQAFIRTFKHSRHTLCIRHLRGNIERNLKDVLNMSQRRKRQTVGRILGGFEGSGQDRQYVPALVDSRSEMEYMQQWEKLAKELELPEFCRWWVKHHQKDFIEKLIQPHRESMGFCDDLPLTNYVESLNKMLKSVCGKHQDVRLLAEKILAIFADEIVFLFEALKGRGEKHRVKAEYQQIFMLDQEKATNERYVKGKVQQMFPHCNAGAMVLFAQNGQIRKTTFQSASASSSIPEETPSTNAEPKSDLESAGQLPSFKSTGLPLMFHGSWHRAAQLDETSMTSLTLEEALYKKPKVNGEIVRVKVQSRSKGNKLYFVEISKSTGRGVCTCYHHVGSRDPACKHIIATAWHKGQLDKLVSWLSKEQNQKPFGQGAMKESGGWKPHGGPRQKTGTGYSKRNGVPTKVKKDETTTNAPTEIQEPPTSKSIPKLAVNKHLSPISGTRAQMAEVKRTSVRPWTEGYSSFRLTRCEGNRSCEGCMTKFAQDLPSVSDLILVRRERHYMAGGARKVTPNDRDSYYHMKMTCIRRRHPDFSLDGEATSMYGTKILCDVEDLNSEEERAYKKFEAFARQ